MVAQGSDQVRRWRGSRSQQHPSRIAYDAIFFDEPGLSNQPAVLVIQDYLRTVQTIVEEAEAKFL